VNGERRRREAGEGGMMGRPRPAVPRSAFAAARRPLQDSLMSRLLVARLGLTPYLESLELQRAVARARIAGEIPDDVLLLVEHPPVVTLGRLAKREHLVASTAHLARRGIEVHEVERGGDVTYHGPGQLVGYPIVDLKRHRQDLHWYLRQVEEALIRALAALGVRAGRSAGLTGVWTGEETGDGFVPSRKVASIGVHARDWVTWHGFALNVATDLSAFELIVPCGIAGVAMTSVAREGGVAAMSDVERAVAAAFAEVFALRPVEVERDALQPVASLGG
jgi:lipoate-protein ligase B